MRDPNRSLEDMVAEAHRPDPRRKRVTISLEDDEHEQLLRAANENHQTVSDFVREAVSEHTGKSIANRIPFLKKMIRK